jgi:DNA-binding HxlR family transcriptional regulator
MRWDELGEERCSIARTVSVIGDRWSLLILRDCFLRVRRFEEFEARLGITRHILADRLRKLVAEGVLKKVPYHERPARYEYRLTQKGLDLYPVLMSIVHWGDTYTAGRAGRPLLLQHMACGHQFDPVLTCSECGEMVDPRRVRVMPGPGAGRKQRQFLAEQDRRDMSNAELDKSATPTASSQGSPGRRRSAA